MTRPVQSMPLDVVADTAVDDIGIPLFSIYSQDPMRVPSLFYLNVPQMATRYFAKRSSCWLQPIGAPCVASDSNE